ncbi:lytic transglycosylase domain-containing protein [Yoonia sp.]|uniref:lytic transglycosylase domain-containing protein n=1 Tax=Yoonia sp. TaxID=2212373 RepID=UPI003918E595
MIYLKAAAGLAVALTASAVAGQDRNSLFQRQTQVLDGRAAQQYSRSVSLQPPSATVPQAIAPYQGRGSGPYLDLARSAAQRHGVPEDLFLRLVQRESGWNPQAVSHKGAIGLAQLMPSTARGLGVDPHDPESNLNGGARYLRIQFDSFGSWPLALAAYNAGPGAVSRHGGVPPYAETKDYVIAVWGE